MTFIRTIPPSTAEGTVREMYDQILTDQGLIPNWAQAFSVRPAVRSGWVALLSAIRQNLSTRRYELATLAAARALHSSYCSLAHGKVLATKVFDASTVASIACGQTEVLEPAEVAIMQFAEKIVHRADQITEGDIATLREYGYSDEEIFDIAATAAARCFFSKLLDALGVQADASYNDLDPTLKQALTTGRPIAEPTQTHHSTAQAAL